MDALGRFGIVLGPPLGALWAFFGRSWDLLSSSCSPPFTLGLPLGAPWAPLGSTWPSLIASWVLLGRPWRHKRVQEAVWIDFRPIVDPLGLILASFLDPYRANSPHRGRHQRCRCILMLLSYILRISLNSAETIVSSAGTSEQQAPQ